MTELEQCKKAYTALAGWVDGIITEMSMDVPDCIELDSCLFNFAWMLEVALHQAESIFPTGIPRDE